MDNRDDRETAKQRKKKGQKEQETFSDGYDSEGYVDDEERERLFKLDEVEREKIITQRKDERANRKFIKQVAEKAKTTAQATNSNINLGSLSQQPTGPEASKKSQVEQDRIQHRREMENRREKYTNSSQSGHHNDIASSSSAVHDEPKNLLSQGQAQHQRDWNIESDEFQKLLKQLTLPNDFLNKLILRSNFKELVKGTYVKVKIGLKYEIYRIEDVKLENSQCILALNNGLKRREMDLKFISNQGVDQSELSTYYEQNYKHEDLQKLKEKKKRFDDMFMKKQEKSEKEKFAEIEATIQKKINEGFFEDEANLNVNELQTYMDFIRDRLLEIESQENGTTESSKESQELARLKKKYQQNQDFLSAKIKKVKHQFMPIFTKNVLEIGSKISEQALNKKTQKIKDKALIRKQKIAKLQQPYFFFENKFNRLSTYDLSTDFKEEIKRDFQSLHLNSAVQRDLANIDISDAAMLQLLNPSKK